MLLENLKLE